MNISPMEEAIAKLGSEAKLGEACGVSQAAIWKAKRAERVSAELSVALERATGIPRWRFRPDLWPQPLPANTPSPTTDEAA